MEITVKILPSGASFRTRRGQSLLKVIKKEHLAIPLPCGGKGICGGCRIRFKRGAPPAQEIERKLLSKKEIEEGIRLACQCTLEEDCEIVAFLPKASECTPTAYPKLMECKGNGIDVGTSTIFIDVQGKCLNFWNPQVVWGVDIISRLQHALDPETRRAMKEILTEAIEKVLEEAGADESAFGVAGNPVMLGILADEELDGLSRYPFVKKHSEERSINIKNAKLILLPEIKGFLGADALCLLTAAHLVSEELPVIAMDIGTNTEMFLIAEGRILGTSLPAGPAFEGFGIREGTFAQEGAIYEVDEELNYKTIGGKPEIGICGSGLISAVYALKQRGFITEDGQLLFPDGFSLGRVKIYQEDIRALQLAKAAVYAGCKMLLRKAQLKGEEIKRIYLAGNFGGALKKAWLRDLKFIPEDIKAPIEYMGNVSLWGAKCYVSSKNVKETMLSLKKKAEVLQLAEEDGFQEAYLEGMKL